MIIDVGRILAGIDYREMLARAADCDLDLTGLELHHTYLDSTEHAAAVAVVAREELAGAVAQQTRHRQRSVGKIRIEGCWVCAAPNPCPDAIQASQTLARLAMLYDAAHTPIDAWRRDASDCHNISEPLPLFASDDWDRADDSTQLASALRAASAWRRGRTQATSAPGYEVAGN